MANGPSGGSSTASVPLLQNPKFLVGAFISALILLILAHKITIEGMIQA